MSYIYNVTKDEQKIIENNIYIKYEKHDHVNYDDGVCIKPWGYEFLIYQSKKIGIWYLNIKTNHSTSLHCHFNKDTIIIVLKGTVKINLMDESIILNEMENIFLPHYNFHGISSFSPESFIIEIEVYNNLIDFSDKNDLLRLTDQYKRKDNNYANSINFTKGDNEQYKYFKLSDNFNQLIEGVEIKVNNCSNINSVVDNNTYNILLDGVIYQDSTYIREGSIMKSMNNIQHLNDTSTILSLKKSNSNESAKIIYNKDQLNILMNKIKDKKIILTSGCFDIIHVGHINNLREAKELGDILMVCLSCDEQIKKLKGEDRPINNYDDRINLFKTITYVDYIILYDETNIETEEELDNIMNIVSPYCWVKGSDYNKDNVLKKHPGLKNIKLINNIKNKSTTNIINMIKNIQTNS
jgi:rfaE bifunctional protein nucleotidyltransferase chain/domain